MIRRPLKLVTAGAGGVLLAPAGVWYAAFFVAPLGFILVFSFLTSADYGGIEYTFNLGNYPQLLTHPIYLRIFLNTMGMAFSGTLLCLLVGFPLAYFLATRAGRWKNLFLVMLIVPFWTSFLTRTYAWLILLSDNGPLAHVLRQANLLHGDLGFLYTYKAVLMGVVYNYLPLMIFPLYVSLERLDKRLIEAAKDLGAGRLQTFWRITVPLTTPGILTGCLLVFIPLTGEYVIPAILGGAKSYMIGNLIGDEFVSAHDWAFGSALGMAVIVLLMFLIAVYFRVARRATTAEMSL
ncbi:MAG TPA: ABC transporter permease [Candidatus Dormibacteraeota bacterium]|nr:ABC transporter permease [Candidatus Dormibacteraeota bacterium]